MIEWRNEGEDGKREGDRNTFWAIERASMSLFVDNLAESMTRLWIWQLFEFEDVTIDVYLSRKKRKSTDIYAICSCMVCQKEWGDEKCGKIECIEIRGNIVLLKEADYKRGIFNKCNEMRICSKMDCTTMEKTYK